ncbi:MAG: hypothetical protein HC904_01210 [Blastochloris sp.]|nr:hypothetical protein [Blastochloris sp.]
MSGHERNGAGRSSPRRLRPGSGKSLTREQNRHPSSKSCRPSFRPTQARRSSRGTGRSRPGPLRFTSLPSPSPEHSPTKKVPKLSMRAHAEEEGKEVEEIPFTDEHRRHLLFTLGSKLKPEIMGSGDPKIVYKHIMEALDQVCGEENVEIDNEIKELLLNAILSGEGLEFQL